ncbi:hypothetical protein GQ457_01G026920 [Hibiscus cannabinus]
MQAFATMTLPIRRVWTGVATRIRVRKRGHMKLRKDVRSCEYEDVRVMWEMLSLSRNEAETVGTPRKRSCQKRTLWNCLEYARRAPFLYISPSECAQPLLILSGSRVCNGIRNGIDGIN